MDLVCIGERGPIGWVTEMLVPSTGLLLIFSPAYTGSGGSVSLDVASSPSEYSITPILRPQPVAGLQLRSNRKEADGQAPQVESLLLLDQLAVFGVL